jgi:hypothetical protein
MRNDRHWPPLRALWRWWQARRRRRGNTIRARATPRSRSATSCPTAGPPRPRLTLRSSTPRHQAPTFSSTLQRQSLPAEAIKKIAELGWKPVHLLVNPSASVGATLKLAGLDNSKGILTTNYLNDPTDPIWKDDAAYKEWSTFMTRYGESR